MAQHDLLQQLLAASSAAQVSELVAAHPETVLSAFPDWVTVPEEIRDDPGAVNHYATTLILVAQVLDAQDHPGPLRTLQGDRDNNPISRWHEAIDRSRALTAAGRPAESIEVLNSVLAELDQLTGSAVDDLRPKVFGALGDVWLQAGDVSQAIRWTQRALQACLANGDRNGIATYRDNLQVLDALHLPTVDPAAGARLLRCRRLIASAQAASDDFDYAESNKALGQALAIIGEGDERLRSSFSGKLYGLRGWNHHYLGDNSAARADTERAVAECQAAGDPDGVRIYTANITFLSK